MEEHRSKTTEIYYMIGIFSLAISLGLLALSLYILPHLALGWRYSVPDFVVLWLNDLQEFYHFSEKAAAWFIFLVFFMPAIAFAVVADILSNRLDRTIDHLEDDQQKQTKRKHLISDY